MRSTARPFWRGRAVGLLFVVAASALSACGSGTASTGPAASSTSATSAAPSSPAASSHAVAGVAELLGISCPSLSSCVAVGATAPNGQGVVVPVSHGHPGSPVVVEGTKALVAVSCSTDASCQAVGIGGGHGVTVAIDAGRPAPAQSHADTGAFQTVSCPETCQVGGSTLGVGALSSAASAVVTVPGTTSVNGIACWAAAACEAIASTSNGKFNDVVVSLEGDHVGPLEVVPPGTSTFSGIACAGSARCLVVGRGTERVGRRLREVPVVVPLRSGKPGSLVDVHASPATTLASVSCPSTTFCAVVGSTGPLGSGVASGHGVLIYVRNGIPGPVRSVPGQELPLDAISCPTVDQCWAVGTKAKETAQVLSLPVEG